MGPLLSLTKIELITGGARALFLERIVKEIGLVPKCFLTSVYPREHCPLLAISF